MERVTFDWRWAEPNPGQYDLSVYDQMYQSLLAQGIRPLFILLFSPWWTWGPGVTCDQWTQNCEYPPGPAHYGDAAAMAAMLATRYPQAAGIEVWNEPNLSAFWRPVADPSAYTALLQAVYPAVKRANPQMPVVLGGLNNLQNNTLTSSSMPDFLGAVYALGGKSDMDAIAFHPYPFGSDLTLMNHSFDEIRVVRHAFGDDSKPLWVTEVGVTTSNLAAPVTETQQASTLSAIYQQISAMSDVRMLIVHTLAQYGDDPFDPEFGFGVLHPDLSPRPAYCALAALRHSTYTCPTS